MALMGRIFKVAKIVFLIGAVTMVTSGCDPTGAVIGGTLGTTVFTGLSPSNSLEQIYYLGVFDPQEQVPPTVYRVRVRGQASAISFMKFASGWVPADLIDSLGTTVQVSKESGQISIEKTGQDLSTSAPTGRKLMLFGPEGFREAPKNHRLVIVMGSDPSDYFEAIDTALGVVSQAQADQRNTTLNRQLFEALAQVKNERERLDELTKDIPNLPGTKEKL